MADLSVTATQILAGADADFFDGTAGATITAGQVVYLDSIDALLKLADSDASLAKANCKGLALHGASSGQPLRIQTGGTITLGAGAAPVVGKVYKLSIIPGGISPIEDMDAGGMYDSNIGVGGALNTVKLSLFASGEIVPAFATVP